MDEQVQVAASATSYVNGPAIHASRRRNVVLIGNCQVEAIANLYNRFVACRTGEQLKYIASYEALSAGDKAALERADLIVQQRLDLPPKADTGGLAAAAPRVFIPMVNAAFLWPFAGPPHPKNRVHPFLAAGVPYSGEASDGYLNRLILAGVEPEEAVDEYMNLDVRKRTNLDRIYELVMDRQRSRDEATGYRIAGVIGQYFRTEQIFLSPYHPNTRVAVELATQFFQRMGAEEQDIERMRRCTRSSPFPRGELPIHPAVAAHFGLQFVQPDRRYRFMNEGTFTFREYALRYMRWEWNEALEEGIFLASAGKLAEAHKRLPEALARSPQSAAGHWALSWILYRQGNLPEALAEAFRAVELEPEFAQYRSQLGVLLDRLGRNEEAETQLRAAIAADPGEPHNLALLASLLQRKGRLEESHQAIEEAIELNPYMANLHENLANVLEAKGKLPEAAAAQERAVELDPRNAYSRHRLARLLGRIEKLEEATQAAEAAVSLDPRVAPFRITLSNALLRQGRSAEALTEALMATLIDDRDAQAYVHLAHVLGVRGDATAELALRRAAVLNPKNPHVHGQLSRLFAESQRFDEAVDAARLAAELDPDSPYRYATLANLLLKRKDLAGAESAQRRAVQLAPETAQFRTVLSELLVRQGRHDEALAEATLAVKHQPQNASALGHLAYVMQLSGDLRRSEKALRQALELDPSNRHFLERLVRIQKQLPPVAAES